MPEGGHLLPRTDVQHQQDRFRSRDRHKQPQSSI